MKSPKAQIGFGMGLTLESHGLDFIRIIIISRIHNLCKSGLDLIDCKCSNVFRMATPMDMIRQKIQQLLTVL